VSPIDNVKSQIFYYERQKLLTDSQIGEQFCIYDDFFDKIIQKEPYLRGKRRTSRERNGV